MKRKIICIGIISMFLLIGLTALSGVGKEVNALKPLSNNNPPTRYDSVGTGTVYYDKDGMSASFSSRAHDDDGDDCRLCVSICKRGTSDKKTYCSDLIYPNDDYKFTVNVPLLPPEDKTIEEYYPIGTYVDWSLWVEDEHGAKSASWNSDLVIARGRSKNINSLFQMFFKNYPNLALLLRILQNLKQ